MKRTPLYETHCSLGATFSEIHDGWELASHFTDAVQEHHIVRRGVGVLDLSHRGRLRLTGRDRARFLHRIISNEVEKLRPGQGNYATILTNRGKIIADMKVIILEDAICLETNPETTETLYRELDKYLIADDVTIEDVTDATGAIGVHGPKSRELLRRALELDPGELAECHSVQCKVDHRRILCVGANETGEEGYNLYAESTSMVWLWDVLLIKGRDLDAQPLGLAALNSLRIEAGIPRFGAELDDSIIPLEAELENALSFEKGCYIGQEIVARMKYRGHPNRSLRGLEVAADTPPQKGDWLFDGEKEVGWITSAVRSPTLSKTIALGYVRTALADAGSKVEARTQSGRVDATIVVLPFYRRRPPLDAPSHSLDSARDKASAIRLREA